MMLGSGNGTIGGMAADVRTDVGEDNTLDDGRRLEAGKHGAVVSESSNRRIQ